MSKISKAVKVKRNDERSKRITNFMGGNSYGRNPLDTLKMITASSIFAEPQYYRDGGLKDSRSYKIDRLFKPFSIFDEMSDKSTTEIMEEAIDASLDYDFKGTIEWAAELRNNFYMRLNPQVIMVRASIHPNRKIFTDKYPGLFDDINQSVMRRADEPASQMSYYLYNNEGKKSNIPSVIKRSWARRLSKASAYEVMKYKNSEIGMIDAVRICHANSSAINELMSTGTIAIKDNGSQTWEQMRSAGKSWMEICETIKIPHMALLRNLRGIFTEITDKHLVEGILETLKEGVPSGKQFPFRYYSAYNAIKNCSDIVYNKPMILEALEDCIDIAVDNMPKLKGRTACLSDNSGSAWGAITSEYGSTQVAVIDNLSSILAAKCSDEGYVYKFGDRIKEFPVTKRVGSLALCNDISRDRCGDIGGSTENGIWLFFRDAIDKNIHWDNIFIYSDQQAGHGGLYGTDSGTREYTDRGFSAGGYVDVMKLIQEYRNKVNPKVNVFTIQTAGYDNVLIPEYAYRCNALYGWTGKETLFASTMINLWDEVDNRNAKKEELSDGSKVRGNKNTFGNR